MAGIAYPIGGGALGVVVPLTSEYALKGARWGATEAEPLKGYKYSGIIGLIQGGLGLILAVSSDQWNKPRLSEPAKAGLGAMGGAGLATGGSILVLDEMRKKGQYTFEKEVALRGREGLEKGLQRTAEPIVPLIEEI